MTARVLQFPARGPFAVRIERERGERHWLVLCRDHGWAHANFNEAFTDANAIARGFGVSVQVSDDRRS
jgi:hypothetical protein